MPTATIIPIEDEMRRSYLDYAMSTIIGRALPDARDGLKPVHRRILFAMYELNNMHDKPYKKSARVVGDVIGKYHPHGDQAVYDAITRMVQEFSLRYPLIDGQGNFGSIDGDSPAAMRYTEVRLSRIAEEILEDIEKDTVEFKLNYDESLKEPVVLPSRVPNLLDKRLLRHRGRHGDEYPAPQHDRGDQRHHRLHRQPLHHHRGVDGAYPRPGFPYRGAHLRQERHTGTPTRREEATYCCGRRRTSRRTRRTAGNRSSSPSSPTRSTRRGS